jgi:hypothetical protein
VYDLVNGLVYLYYMHDYSNVKVFNLSEEMSLGFNSYYMSELFNDDNICPNAPETPIGTSNGKINEDHTYTSSTTDIDGDNVYYLWDWGDGNDSGWLGPFDSGEICEVTYSWSNQGNYEIRVKAKDIYGDESDWSDPLTVSMPKNKLMNFLFIKLIKNYFFYLTNFDYSYNKGVN